MTDFRCTSRACPDGPHEKFPVVDQLAIQTVLLGGNQLYERAEREYLCVTNAVHVPPSRIPTDLDPGDSVRIVMLFEEAARAAGIPPIARLWVVPYVMAMNGWYLLQRPPHLMLLYGGLRAFERFGAPMTAELPFLADFARHARARFDAKCGPD